MSPAVTVDAVGLRYRGSDHAALTDVSLDIAAGEVVALLGHNGAGKSSLMSIIAGVTHPDTGSVTVDGAVGLAAQEDAVYPTLSGRANLAYVGRLCGLSGTTLDDRIAAVSSDLLLDGFLDRRAGSLSGGERRRLHTAMALVHTPPVALLDEPTAGVDVETRSHLLASVTDMAARGAAVLYSTHYLPEVVELDARVCILDGGRVAAVGTVAELIARFAVDGVELVFDRPGVDLGPLEPHRVDGPSDTTVLLELDDPDGSLGDVVERLGPAAAHLVEARVHRATFDQAFRRLAGTEASTAAGGDA